MQRRHFVSSTSALLAAAVIPPKVARAQNNPTVCDNPKPFSSLTDSRSILSRRYVGALQSDSVALAKLRTAYANYVTWGNAHPTDPRGYPTQWYIHNVAGETLGIHSTWAFFPWHRAYLYFHERILAWHATGEQHLDPTFRLFTWDWDDVTTPSGYLPIPAAFTGDSRNPLWHDRPYPTPLSLQDIDPTPVLRLPPNYFYGSAGDSGALSEGPHGWVHEMAGGDMKDPAVSTKDPVFFAHHSNVDKMWAWYKALPGGGDPSGSAFTGWAEQSWTFTDYDGTCYQVSAADVVDLNRLCYSYPDPSRPIAGPSGVRNFELGLQANPAGSELHLPDAVRASTATSAIIRLTNVAVPGRGGFALDALTTEEPSLPIGTIGTFVVFGHDEAQTVTAYVNVGKNGLQHLRSNPNARLGIRKIATTGRRTGGDTLFALEWSAVTPSQAQILLMP